MTTIPKTTKKAKAIIATAQNIRCFSLSDNFSGMSLSEKPTIWGGPVVNNQFTQLVQLSQSEFLLHELEASRNAKLTGENGRYSINIHSNCWYEFESAA